MKVLAITQARYGSTRLPAKILKEVNGITLLEYHLKRLLKSSKIDKLKIATTGEDGSKFIVEIADKLGIGYHKGSVDDVLSRFYDTAKDENPEYVVRLTSDCPLIDPEVVDQLIEFAINSDYDYVSTDAESFPDGLDVEVFKFSALERAYKEANLKSEREHVTPYIWKNGTACGGTLFKSFKFKNPAGDYNANDHRITLDEPEDFEVIKNLIEVLGPDRPWLDYINFLVSHKDIYEINSRFGNNEGYAKSVKNDSLIDK